jgi:pyrimidine-specific ribonucleoside hydrolase
MTGEAVSRPVLIDCDPGHDDALAILLAARHFDVLAITTVAGNVDVDRTTLNALRIAELAGLEVPVARGCAAPLVRAAAHADAIHGASGLDGHAFPPVRREPDRRHAVDLLIETARGCGDLTIIAIGPLTNLAVALRTAPDITSNIRGISLMGGSVAAGNVTAAAEFNTWFDPEAADVVFRSGVPLWMCGLNLTRQASVDREHLRRIEAIGTHAARAVASLLRFYLGRQLAHEGNARAPLHDPCAVAMLLEPPVIASAPMHVAVELRGEHTRGMTVCDARHIPELNPAASPAAGPRGEPPNARVGMRLDRPAFFDLLEDALAART